MCLPRARAHARKKIILFFYFFRPRSIVNFNSRSINKSKQHARDSSKRVLFNGIAINIVEWITFGY